MERPLTGVNPHVIHKVVLLLESGPTARDIAMERPLTGVDSLVARKVLRSPESGHTARDIAMERPLTGVDSLVVRKDVRSPESGPTAKCIALVRPFAGVCPFVLGGLFQRHFFAALLESAENPAIREPSPLRSPDFARRSRRRRAGYLARAGSSRAGR
jgi:hypothetical protein